MVTPFSAEWADRILEARNVDGKVPLDIFWRLIDAMSGVRSLNYVNHEEESQ